MREGAGAAEDGPQSLRGRPAARRAAALEVRMCQCVLGAQPLFGLPLQQPEEQGLRRLGRGDLAQGFQAHAMPLDVPQDLAHTHARPGKGMLVSVHDVEHDTYGPHVALGTVLGATTLLASEDLWRYEVNGANGLVHPQLLRRLHALRPEGGEPEVDNLHHSPLVVLLLCEEAIIELQVSVHDALAVAVRDGRHHVVEQQSDLLFAGAVQVQLTQVATEA
mmetsp:Transcript_147252/g.472975  ORF Transcript_147252/g.472975 Transcript_147252/m.472975 type:complete len:220 (+) Transcript_147252:684-1343(+)